MGMTISIIVAIARGGVMGDTRKSPLWDLPADLQHFKSVTMGHPVIMGRKTHEGIGRPLAGRKNIIITRSKDYKSDDCVIVHSLQEAFDAAGADAKVFVIGGGEIYKQALPYADKLYVTKVDAPIRGDIFFSLTPSNGMKSLKKITNPMRIINTLIRFIKYSKSINNPA